MLPPVEILSTREHAVAWRRRDAAPNLGTKLALSKALLRWPSNLQRRALRRAGDPADASPRSPVETLMIHDNLPRGGPAP